MKTLPQYLSEQLETLRGRSLLRQLRPIESPQTVQMQCNRRPMLAFASNDYLGLANHPALKKAAKDALDHYGAGSGASRLITGSLPPHRKLEKQLASFKETEASLAFGSGYQTAVGAIACLLSENDVLLSDRFNHACIIDGARLSKAQIQIFEHNDLDHLESLLKAAADGRTRSSHPVKNIWIVTESVFSMEGDQAPLPEIAALKNRYETWLMIDEAHATGIFGARRQGLAEQTKTREAVDVHMGTLGKAVGASGGFICGSQALIDFLVNQARTFVFSTAPAPATAAAATAGIQIIQSPIGKERNTRLWQRVRQLRRGLRLPEPATSPIVPYRLGTESRSLQVSAQLEKKGLLVPAIRYPSVPKNQARLRITLSAQHSENQVIRLLDALQRIQFDNPSSHS